MILKITRDFEKVISKIITSKEGQKIINILKEEKYEAIDTIEYHKARLIDEEGVKKIETKLNQELTTKLENFQFEGDNEGELFSTFMNLV
tara:strand:- start:1004 stop:1273 length:270 start_codon:yes stop_codon:yes gene_type:complete